MPIGDFPRSADSSKILRIRLLRDRQLSKDKHVDGARVNNDENNCCNGNCFHLTLLCQTCEQQAKASAYRSERRRETIDRFDSVRIKTRIDVLDKANHEPVELFIYQSIY